MNTMRRQRSTAAVAMLSMSALFLAMAQVPRCDAQTQAQSESQAKIAELHEPLPAGTAPTKGTAAPAAAQPAAPPDPEFSLDVAKELAVMRARIDQLEAELKSRSAGEPAPVPGTGPAAKLMVTPPFNAANPAVTVEQQAAVPTAAPGKPAPTVPFAYADWTWLNGNPRNKDAVWDSPFFTPEIRVDTHYVEDFNHPRDDTMGGSTEIFRSNEFQVEQISFGGNFHWQNVQARILTMNGMFGITTPRNDASAGRGQWDLRGA